MKKDAWRITRKLDAFEACLATSKVEDYVQFRYKGGENTFGFDLDEAQFLHGAVGAILAAMPKRGAEAKPELTKQSNREAPAPTAKPPAVSPVAPPDGLTKNGKRWSEEEDQKLIAAFQGGQKIEDLCTNHCRSPAAVVSRLLKHDLIEVSAKATTAPGAAGAKQLAGKLHRIAQK